MWLLLLQGLTWWLLSVAAAIAGLVLAVVVIVAIEGLRDTRLKVVVRDGVVECGRLAGAPMRVGADDVGAVVLVPWRPWTNSRGHQVVLALRDGTTVATPLRALADDEAKLREAAERVAVLTGAPISSADRPNSPA